MGIGVVGADWDTGVFSPSVIEDRLSLIAGPTNVRKLGLHPTAGDKSSIWATIVASATTSNPLDLYFPPGTYRFDTPWPTIDPMKIRIRCAGQFHTTFDFTRLASGPAIDVQKAVGNNNKHIVLSDVNIAGPTSGGTTVDGINLGSASTFANQCVFERVRVDHFRDAWVLNDNTWCIDWVDCYENAQIRYAFNAAGTANAGENYSLIGGTIAASGSDCIRATGSNGATFNLFGVSLDYSNHLITLQNGNRVNMFGGHIECGDAQTGAELMAIIKGSTYNPALVLKGVTLYAAWTSAGTIKTVVRVSGTTGATNDNAVIDLDGLEVTSGAGPTGVNALVIDQSTVGTLSLIHI